MYKSIKLFYLDCTLKMAATKVAGQPSKKIRKIAVDIEALITVVAEHKVLFDKTEPDYKDAVVIRNTWSSVADVLGLDCPDAGIFNIILISPQLLIYTINILGPVINENMPIVNRCKWAYYHYVITESDVV